MCVLPCVVRQCECAIVQTLHFAGQAVVHVRIPVYGCCMACEVVADHRVGMACGNPYG